MKGKKFVFNEQALFVSSYRPFCRQNLYFGDDLVAMTYQNHKFFPTSNTENLVICVSGLSSNKDNGIFISNTLVDLNCLNAGTQCFPLYYYEEVNRQSPTLWDAESMKDYVRHDAVSNFIIERARKQYGKNVTKEDIFYYVYGFLHSPKYRKTFAADLKKMLPRLPLVDNVRDFWAFSQAGRKLADLHLNYENVERCRDVIEIHNPLSITDALAQANSEELEYIDYRVEQMRFPRKGQKDIIIYNSRITLENIPAEAYEYVVNGKSAVEWIMERYAMTTHKESSIKNDPNDWALETGKPRYILDLLLSVIAVSIQTMDIVKELPEVEFEAVKQYKE
jgi:predicted helicase